MNPQFSIPAVEACASRVVGSFPSVDESASPVYNQVHQEQIAAEQESVECVQQHTVEQICARANPSDPAADCGVIPRELFPDRIEEQIVDFLAPPIVKEMAEVVQIIP